MKKESGENPELYLQLYALLKPLKPLATGRWRGWCEPEDLPDLEEQ